MYSESICYIVIMSLKGKINSILSLYQISDHDILLETAYDCE